MRDRLYRKSRQHFLKFNVVLGIYQGTSATERYGATWCSSKNGLGRLFWLLHIHVQEREKIGEIPAIIVLLLLFIRKAEEKKQIARCGN